MWTRSIHGIGSSATHSSAAVSASKVAATESIQWLGFY
jgi:hypothetical protein